jgi:hypothetical protein
VSRPDKPKQARPDKPKPDKPKQAKLDKPKHDKADKPKQDKHDKADKPKQDKHDKKDKDSGSVPVPLVVGLVGWLRAIRRRLTGMATLVGARIRWTERIRKKAMGGIRGSPQKGSERPAGAATCPGVRSAAVWWRTRPGSCAPGASTRIRHPT